MQRRKFSREFKLEAVRLVSARPVRAPLSTITLAEQTHRPTLRAKPCTQHGVEGPLPMMEIYQIGLTVMVNPLRPGDPRREPAHHPVTRSEAHTAELQSLMR